MNNGMTLWKPDNQGLLPPSAKTLKEIVHHAVQLKTGDKRQIVSAFESGHYEMGLNFLWLRTIAALKKELAKVGVSLLGEMLGRVGVSEDADVEDLLTSRDAIRLARELGVVTETDALRLRHTYEIITHFNQLAVEEGDGGEIDITEAMSSLKACVMAVLVKPRVDVATDFIEFRKALESESFAANEKMITDLKSSPYFFWKLTIDILMDSAKNSTGAKLEHCLINTNVLLPRLWLDLRETEKWRIGRTYAEVYSEGKKAATSGLKQALMKVQGFDFVPENLRSDTFLTAAQEILRAHDGMYNFYSEPAPTRNLAQLGTSIPVPALPGCMTALLSVVLGNEYGVSWEASGIASDVLQKLSNERWEYYLNQVLPADSRVLAKLVSYPRPRARWTKVVARYGLSQLQIKERGCSMLVKAQNDSDIMKHAGKLYHNYYNAKNTKNK